jgi:hypothetical protein
MTKTCYPELAYEQVVRGCWRFIDVSTNRYVGPSYPTEVQLLADLERFAGVFGAGHPTHEARLSMTTYTLMRCLGAQGTPSGMSVTREPVATIEAEGIAEALSLLSGDMGIGLWAEDDPVIPMDDGKMLPVCSDDMHLYSLHWGD